MGFFVCLSHLRDSEALALDPAARTQSLSAGSVGFPTSPSAKEAKSRWARVQELYLSYIEKVGIPNMLYTLILPFLLVVATS